MASAPGGSGLAHSWTSRWCWAAAAISLTYLIEIDSVCLIDQVTGERARMIAEALEAEIAVAETLGLPIPDTVDDPKCRDTTGVWLVLIMGLSILVFLGYNIKVWGLPLVSVAILVALYTIGTVLVWYFHGPEDINKYLMTKLGGEPRTFYDGIPNVHDALVNNSAGLLGRFMAVIMSTVFPYIILGALFGKSAGGQTLIKLAFRWTRNMRGGPAHAAIISSAMFGTISGGPVVNVLSTGVLTIPMMIKRGFSRVFAGGVEAAASSGGSIMPPVMGIVAFILAAMTGVPYRDVIVAAAIPAVAYFFCLFLSAAFQSRKQGIEAIGEFTDDMRLSREDFIHLLQIFLPMLLILVLLLTPKDNVGCGTFAWLLGADAAMQGERCVVNSLPWLVQAFQNAAGDAGATGWWAAMLVIVLLFLDKDVRAKPRKVIDGLADAGITLASLYLMLLAVSVIDVCLNFTGLSKFVAIDVLRFLLALDLGRWRVGSVPADCARHHHAPGNLAGHGNAARASLHQRGAIDGPDACGLGDREFYREHVHFLLRNCRSDHPARGPCCLRGLHHHQGRAHGHRFQCGEIRRRDVFHPLRLRLLS